MESRIKIGSYLKVFRQCFLHVASIDNLTYYGIHPKQGKANTGEVSILPNFNVTAVHDSWDTYFKYGYILHILLKQDIWY